MVVMKWLGMCLVACGGPFLCWQAGAVFVEIVVALLCWDGAHVELVLDGVMGQVRDDYPRILDVDQPNAFSNEGLGIGSELC
jgi:hypothetical protein